MKVSPIINATFSIGSTSVGNCGSEIENIADAALCAVIHRIDQFVIHGNGCGLTAVQRIELLAAEPLRRLGELVNVGNIIIILMIMYMKLVVRFI